MTKEGGTKNEARRTGNEKRRSTVEQINLIVSPGSQVQRCNWIARFSSTCFAHGRTHTSMIGMTSEGGPVRAPFCRHWSSSTVSSNLEISNSNDTSREWCTPATEDGRTTAHAERYQENITCPKDALPIAFPQGGSPRSHSHNAERRAGVESPRRGLQ